MEAVAKYDFKATADDELSFKRGEILKAMIANMTHSGQVQSLYACVDMEENTTRNAPQLCTKIRGQNMAKDNLRIKLQ